MITKVIPFDLKTKKYSQKTSDTKSIVNQPLQSNISVSSYSTNQLKANYMPVISFGSATATPKTGLEAEPQKKELPNPAEVRKRLLSQLPYDSSYVVGNLSPKERLEGHFYDKLADDLAIILTSNKDGLLIAEPGVSPEIFAQKFEERIAHGEYQKLGFEPKDTDVVYIEDPIAFSTTSCMETAIKETADSELLKMFGDGNVGTLFIDTSGVKNNGNYFLHGLEKLDASCGDRTKVVIVRDFDKVLGAMGDFFHGRSLQVHFMNKYQNLHIVGVIDQRELESPKEVSVLIPSQSSRQKNLLTHVRGFPQLPLRGLSVPETQEFLRRNPSFYFRFLDKYKPCYLDVSSAALRRIIETAAKDSGTDMALPSSALLLLDRVAAAKLQATRVQNPRAVWRITSADVERYKARHKDLVNISKNPDVKIEIVEDISTTMDDIAGLGAAKEKFEDIFEYIKNPKKFLSGGRKEPGGVLLTGEPGTGKTELARAVVGEVKKRTGQDIPFFRMSDFGNNYINSAAMAMNQSYEEAREYCRRIGVKVGIMFIDEADKIGRKISANPSAGQSEDNKATNALKEHLDGMDSKASDIRIITIAATNHPEVLDESLLRPSRFKVINCPIPLDKATVEQLLHIHAKNKPFANETEKKQLLSELADYVRGLNGDQMTEILDEATRLALKADKKIGRKELVDGLFQTLYGSRIHRDYILEDRLITVAHEWGHAINTPSHRRLVAILNESRDIPRIGAANALCHFAPKIADVHETFDTVIDTIAGLYGGGEAEKLLSPAHASGVSNDYSKISETIDDAVTKCNLGIYTPARSFYRQDDEPIEYMFEQYGSELKADNELFAETGQRISRLRVQAYKDLAINTYLRENREAILKGNDGKNYLGYEFDEMVDRWLKDSGMIKAKPVLDNGITAIKTIAFNDKFWTQQARVNNARNIMSDAVESIIGISQERSWLDNPSRTAEGLNKHIERIVSLAENGSKWLARVGKDRVEEKLVKTVRHIVEAAKNGETKGFIQRIIKQASTIR